VRREQANLIETLGCDASEHTDDHAGEGAKSAKTA